MPKRGKFVKFKNYERKIKSPFIIYADFESILVPENSQKQNPEEHYTNKYQKYIACSYGYKLSLLRLTQAKMHYTILLIV